SERRRLTGIVRNLKIVVIVPGQEGESAGVVDDVRQINEFFELVGVIVDRAAAARWIFDADAVMQITLGDVITEPSGNAAALETFHEGVETSDIDGSLVADERRASLGVNVDHAGLAKTELSRQRAGHERNVVGKTRRQFRPETGDALR